MFSLSSLVRGEMADPILLVCFQDTAKDSAGSRSSSRSPCYDSAAKDGMNMQVLQACVVRRTGETRDLFLLEKGRCPPRIAERVYGCGRGAFLGGGGVKWSNE